MVHATLLFPHLTTLNAQGYYVKLSNTYEVGQVVNNTPLESSTTTAVLLLMVCSLCRVLRGILMRV
jgi:hypothetical protein